MPNSSNTGVGVVDAPQHAAAAVAVGRQHPEIAARPARLLAQHDPQPAVGLDEPRDGGPGWPDGSATSLSATTVAASTASTGGSSTDRTTGANAGLVV